MSSHDPSCCWAPDVLVGAIPANLFTSGMFQTGVFAGFWDLGSFVASVPTCWEEMKKPAARIEFPVRTNMIVTGYALALVLLFLFQLQMLLW